MARIAKKDVKDNAVQFDFVDGTKMDCPVDDLPDDMVRRLALHGIAQKVGDSYASAESVSEAIGNAKAVWDNLVAGVWATRAAKGGKFVEALARVTGKAYDECLAAWNDMDDKRKAEMKKHSQMKAAVAEIEAERAQKLAKDAEGKGDDADLTALF